jgi:hypothetical protein
MAILETVLGVVAGGLGSWISKGIGLAEMAQKHRHELELLKIQRQSRQDDAEHEMAIAQEETLASMRQASYVHDSASGKTSQWVNNLLRLVRPVLTLILMILVFTIWVTIGQDNPSLQFRIVDGVLFMASAAMAWWFGDRAQHNRKLPWQ